MIHSSFGDFIQRKLQIKSKFQIDQYTQYEYTSCKSIILLISRGFFHSILSEYGIHFFKWIALFIIKGKSNFLILNQHKSLDSANLKNSVICSFSDHSRFLIIKFQSTLY